MVHWLSFLEISFPLRGEKKNYQEDPLVRNEELQKEKRNGDIVTFEKTYSFRNLPRGRVARLQKQFEATGLQEYHPPPQEKPKRSTTPRRHSSSRQNINVNMVVEFQTYWVKVFIF